MTSEKAQNASRLLNELGAVRHNGGMPARLPIPEGMPEEAVRAQRLLASHGRVVVIQYLLSRGSATRVDVVKATGLTKATTFKVLNELEAVGFIVADLNVDERHGRSVGYRADADRVNTAIIALTSWLLGRPVS